MLLSGKDEFTAKYEEYAVDNSRKPKHKSIFVAIIVLVILVLAFALLLIKNIEEENKIKRNKENEQNKFEEKYKFVKRIKCSALSEKINSFGINYSEGGGFFVNGKGYTLYLNKKVSSTNENCEVNNYYTYDWSHNIKESTDVGKFVSVAFIHFHNIESDYIFTTNGYYCYYGGICYTVGDETISDYQTPLYYYNRIKNAANELGFSLEDASNYQMFIETTTFYVYYNNKLYIEVDGLFREVEMNLDKDEYIEKITHHIRTNKAYYDIEDYVTNREECQEYMDVECKTNYKLIPSKTLNLKYDEIYYADYFVILKDGSIYIDKTKQKKLDGLLNTELGI